MRNILMVAAGMACFLLGGCSGLVSVQVLDDFTGVSVVGAKISYTAAGSDTQKGLAVTDLEGEAYVLIPKNADNLVVSKSGYAPLTVSVEGIDEHEMEMGVKLRMTPIGASPVSGHTKDEWPKWN